MRRQPPRDEPPRGRLRRERPQPEGPFERLLRQRPERDPAPIIIGGTIAFLALVIVLVFVFSSLLGGGDDSGGDGKTVEVAPGVNGRLVQMPPLPPGLLAQSQYIEFETEEAIQAIVGLPLTTPTEDPAGMGFYTYIENRWQRQADVTLQQDGKLAQGEFDTVPANLAVLRVLPQSYQVGASLPHDTTLHGDAGSVQILSPRDYVPASDGSVQGTASEIEVPEGTLLLATIVGSTEDTAAVVDDILDDESKRAQHVQNIAALVENAGLAGIDLEYSSVDADLSGEFTEFVAALADSLHGSDKRLSLTLPPPTGQKQAYDWKKLAEKVDFFKVLPIADPETYWEAMPGALAQITRDVDARKVMLVVSPFSIQGQGDSAHAIGYLQAMVLASQAALREPKNPDDMKPGTNIKFVARNLDEGEGASPMKWDTDSLTVSFAMGGTDRARIYIENSYSLGFKLELVQAYALGGVSVSDGSGQSDVANFWPALRQFVSTATASLVRPNDAMLVPTWEAPDGGEIAEASGTSVTWVPDASGQFNIILVVSDGERRFGQKTLVEVRGGAAASVTPSPLQSFAPDTGTPTPTATGTPDVRVEVGKVADGDDADLVYSNTEIVTPGSDVTYLITIDNDSNVPVTIETLEDSLYSGVECKGPGDATVIGVVLAPDDGDGTGSIDGGADQVQCKFTKAAPGGSGVSVDNTITVVVKDEEGNSATDHDDTRVTTATPAPSP